MVQTLALLAILVGPIVGGWQRLDYTRDGATWADIGWGLPVVVQQGLPIAYSSDTLYRANQVIGGGIAAELFSVPFMDPLAGTLALLGGGTSLRTMLALALPIALALFAGRVFCGWFCAFGTISRWLDALCARLPRYRFLALPDRRWLRFGVLAATVTACLLGSHLLLYLLLPYLLLQQSVYAAWLLGGGSAIVGVFGGLLFAGILFGPTTYCAALCPTGTLLSIFGRLRVLRLAQPAPSACGAHCDLCDRACWLQLKPSSGNPGPDCDLCARCVSSCPRSNLVITGPVRPILRERRVGMSSLVILLALTTITTATRAADHPALILDAEITRKGVTIAASAIDYRDFQLAYDWALTEPIVELSIFIARGDLHEPDRNGIIRTREIYRGPLSVEILRASEESAQNLEFREPNSPISAQRRRIYRARLSDPLFVGDIVRVDAIPNWLDEGIEFRIPRRGSRVGSGLLLQYFAASALGFSALLSLAFVSRQNEQ